jgi:hypothetical protein
MFAPLCSRGHVAALLVALVLLPVFSASAQLRPLTFEDVMRFRTIQNPSISDDGTWVTLAATPDRGDGSVMVRSTRGETVFIVERGSRPAIGKDGRYVAMRLEPALAETERASGNNRPRPGLVLLETATGDTITRSAVESHALSADGRFSAWLHFDSAERNADTTEVRTEGKRKAGNVMVLRELATGREVTVQHVRSFRFDEDGRFLAYSVASPGGGRDGVYVRQLSDADLAERAVMAAEQHAFGALAWSKSGARLGFVAAAEDADGETGPATLFAWSGTDARPLVDPGSAPDGWHVPMQTSLRWSDDGRRLHVGLRPGSGDIAAAAEQDGSFDPYDLQALLDKRTIDVWHWEDARIATHRSRMADQMSRRTYDAVYHLDGNRLVQLETLDRQIIGRPQGGRAVLAREDGPYLLEATWEGGGSHDLFYLPINGDAPRRLAEGIRTSASLSPSGRFAAFFQDEQWHLYDAQRTQTTSLTATMDVSFADELHDQPMAPGHYGVAGWVEGDRAILIYDRFDIWRFPLDGGAPVKLTDGRRDHRVFRVVNTDPDREWFGPSETVLVSMYDDRRKIDGFYQLGLDRPGAEQVLETRNRYNFIARAPEADLYLYTREAYDEFPDLWVANRFFSETRRLTDINPQIADFNWGTSELVEWLSIDGKPHQGAVFKPSDYDPSRTYPVIVYFYERFSQRVNQFYPMAVNHRPSIPLYVSQGYVVFFPDVWYETGRPGYSATKSIVPGVHRLIDMGIADPRRVGLHGHSWSGYQAAHMVTQTDIFAATIAGAPVSNMVSAYSGIRWGTGLARQFQYERTQSRLGRTLWEARDLYIDNSPVFFADRINTPMLIIFGDKDGAVPWEQGIELHLAMRRLGKPSIMLQYHGEDHHPAAYPNKLDWAVKMKEYFDHYLMDAPAPAWMTQPDTGHFAPAEQRPTARP